MNKEQARKELEQVDKRRAELQAIVNAPEKPTAKQWLINFLNENAKKWRVEMGQDRMIFYLEDQWIFDLDLKNKNFWCYYYRVWDIFYKEYNMDFYQVQQLIKDVVLKPFNCDGFTPNKLKRENGWKVLKPFNCEGFTPPDYTALLPVG